MNDIDNQAFPAAWGNPEQGGDYVPGMSLRDWFAGQALAGILAKNSPPESHAAKRAYAIADAMMEARKEHLVRAETPEGRAVIVRSSEAGVLYGNLRSIEGRTVRLANARQLWRWHAAKGHTLIDVACHGVIADKCKFSPSSADTTILNACAVIDVTTTAAKSIEDA